MSVRLTIHVATLIVLLAGAIAIAAQSQDVIDARQTFRIENVEASTRANSASIVELRQAVTEIRSAIDQLKGAGLTVGAIVVLFQLINAILSVTKDRRNGWAPRVNGGKRDG